MKVLCQSSNENIEAKIRREHQKIAGTSSEVAIEKFLEEASLLDLYGVELYHVLDSNRERKVIGVGPDSVQIHSYTMEPLKRCVYSQNFIGGRGWGKGSIVSPLYFIIAFLKVKYPLSPWAIF